MKMRVFMAVAISLSVAACAQQPAAQQAGGGEGSAAPAARPAAAPAGGLNGTPEQQAKQAELEKNTPQLKVSEEVLKLIGARPDDW